MRLLALALCVICVCTLSFPISATEQNMAEPVETVTTIDGESVKTRMDSEEEIPDESSGLSGEEDTDTNAENLTPSITISASPSPSVEPSQDEDLADTVVPDEESGSSESGTEEDGEEETTGQETTLPDNSVYTKKVSGEGYIVSVKYDAMAALPEDAVMQVSELSNAEYDNCKNIAQLLLDEDQFFSNARFFDISFMQNDAKILPAEGSNVNVTMEFIDEMNFADGIQTDVIRIRDGYAEKIDAEVISNNTVSFVADGTSLYGVAVRTAEKTEEPVILKAGTAEYTVTVSCPAEAQIPENAELVVTPMSDSAKEYIHTGVLQLGELDYGSHSYALDIKIMAEGQEIQPAVPVQVCIGSLDMGDTSEISVYHFPGISAESMKASACETNAVSTFALEENADMSGCIPSSEVLFATVEDDGVKFLTSSFSVFYVKTGGTITYAEVTGEDPNFIIVQKTFNGITSNQIPGEFAITVSNGTASYILTKENVVEKINGANIIWKWKIIGADTGTYTVTESGYEIENYDVESNLGDNNFTVTPSDMEITDNYYETTCKKTNWPVSEGTFFTASLKASEGVVVITQYSLSAAQRKKVESYILNMSKGPWKPPVHFYSLEEQIDSGNGFVLGGISITYNFSTKEIEIGSKDAWQHLATLTYNIQQAQNPEIGIINDYKKQTVPVNIAKQVTGSMGDRNKVFHFNVACNQPMEAGDGYELSADGLMATFTLAHNQNLLINGVKKGATLTITESGAEDYTKKLTVNGSVLEGNTYTIPSELIEQVSIIVTNNKDGSPDTGVFLDSLPYVFALIFVIAGGMLLFLTRIKNREDD